MEKDIQQEHHIWFESVEEAQQEIPALMNRNSTNKHYFEHYIQSHYAYDYSWLGIDGGPPAMLKAIHEGWPEQTARLHHCMKSLDAGLDLETVRAMTIDVRKRKRVRDEYGDAIDMPRVWNGDLERAWERPVRIPRRAPSQRYVTIYVDLAASAFRKAQDSVWRAATALKICDLFTSAGFSTEIWVGGSVTGLFYSNSKKSWTGIRVKEFTQPLNEDRLAAMTSVGMLRTYGFMMKSACADTINDNYGLPMNSGLAYPLRERQEAGERVIRIGECWSQADAVREVAAVAQSLLPKKLEEAS